MSKLIEKLKLSDIKANAKTQVRIVLNPEALEDYTQHAKDSKEKGADPEFPPLVVFRDEKNVNHLADGFTRRASLKAAGIDSYDCEIRKGSAFDAFKFGAKINQTHGARLTTKDKRNILSIALDDLETCKLSNNAIAKDYGFSEFFVRTHRPKNKTPEAVEAVSKSGKKTKVKTGKIGKKGGKGSKSKASNGTTADENAGIDAALGDAGGDTTGTVGSGTKQAVDDETKKAISRITRVCVAAGVPGADKIESSIEDGTLPLSNRDIKDWAGTSDGRIVQAAGLVLNNRWKPKQSLAFIDKEVSSQTKIDHLINLAIAGGKGYAKGQGNVFERVSDTKAAGGKSYLVTVFDTSKVTVAIDDATGVITISPK